MRYVVFGMGIVYILGVMDTTQDLYRLLVFSPEQILSGQIWRLFTFVFIPPNMHPIWIAVALYLSFFLGTSLEQIWGTAKFNVYFLLSVVLFAVTGMLFHFFLAPFFPFAALSWPFFFGYFVSGYFLHLFLIIAYATYCPDVQFRLFFVLPVPAKWLGLATFVFLLFHLFRLSGVLPLNLVPLVLLIPYFLFCGGALGQLLRLRSRVQTKSAINFKRAAKKIAHERETRPYSRKCEICGKTDADYPNMEFRYCSRCNGYRCFCMDHINSHVHFQ